MELVIFILVSLGFLYLTVRRGSLSVDGALATGLLAGVVVSTAGPAWLLPLFVFFLSSVLIGRLLPVADDAGDAKDRQPRDAVQVLCNGGVYGLVALLGGDPVLLLVTMAVATADTWGSEIGKYIRQPTYDILRGRRVPAGLSGGVSAAGTLGAGAGAVLAAGCGPFLLDAYPLTTALAVSSFGFAGMLLDSVLGAALQARYRGADGRPTDRARPGSPLIGGYRWMTNDLVNVVSIAATTALAWWWLTMR